MPYSWFPWRCGNLQWGLSINFWTLQTRLPSHKWDFSKILPHDKINQIIKNAISLILRWDQLRSTKNLELAHLRRGPLFLAVWIFNRWSRNRILLLSCNVRNHSPSSPGPMEEKWELLMGWARVMDMNFWLDKIKGFGFSSVTAKLCWSITPLHAYGCTGPHHVGLAHVQVTLRWIWAQLALGLQQGLFTYPITKSFLLSWPIWPK